MNPSGLSVPAKLQPQSRHRKFVLPSVYASVKSMRKRLQKQSVSSTADPLTQEPLQNCLHSLISTAALWAAQL